MTMIFETHAHYSDRAFDADRDELIKAVRSAGISPVVEIGSSLRSSRASAALAARYEDHYAAVGVHPSDIDCLEDNLDGMEELRSMCAAPKVAAVGEIGLDYYWEKDPKVQERQKYWFLAQLALARELDLPVVIHSRDAAADTMAILKEATEAGSRGVVHCYSYSPEQAEEYVRLGWYIGVGGVVTFKNGRKLAETVRRIPLERILLETDAPYLSPEPNRGKRNDSRNLHFIAEKVAELKGVSKEEVVRITAENARRMYRL